MLFDDINNILHNIYDDTIDNITGEFKKNIYDIKIKILFDKYGVKNANKLTKLRDTIGNIIIKKKN